MANRLTRKQYDAAKDNLYDEIASALSNTIHGSWITLEIRAKQIADIANQLKDSTVED